MQDIIFLLLDEYKTNNKLDKKTISLIPMMKEMFAKFGGHQCSMFGVWGSRTVDGHLFSARNLGKCACVDIQFSFLRNCYDFV